MASVAMLGCPWQILDSAVWLVLHVELVRIASKLVLNLEVAGSLPGLHQYPMESSQQDSYRAWLLSLWLQLQQGTTACLAAGPEGMMASTWHSHLLQAGSRTHTNDISSRLLL